jgi:hypothetical protein
VTHERETMTHVVHGVAVLSLCLMSGCVAMHSFDPDKETVLPLNRAWVSGRQVEYVTTDISDAAMARAAGVNYAPRLRDTIGARPSVLERVYKFPQGGQLSIFQSAPQPVGPGSTDLSYSPLWRLALVKWIKPEQARELHTEEDLLAAQEIGLLSIEVTNVVVNCPITKEISP